MTPETIVGLLVIAGAVATMLLLYAWCWRRIEAIHRKGPMNLRQIQKEFGHGRRPDGTP